MLQLDKLQKDLVSEMNKMETLIKTGQNNTNKILGEINRKINKVRLWQISADMISLPLV